MKGCVHMNPKTCITIDVSQGKSHIQGFIGPNHQLSKARTMRHTKQGYQFILTLLDLVKTKSNTFDNPLIIFEYTGIYHKSLEKFLISNNLQYHIVAPLRAAKARNEEIREQKTDARDCLSLSKLFYSNKLGLFNSEDGQYSKLRKLNRFYDVNMKLLVKLKVNFRETLAVIYPCYNKLFSSVYSDESLAFLKLFPHPDYFTKLSSNTILSLLYASWNHLQAWTNKKVKTIIPFINDTISGCNFDDPDISMLLTYIEQIEYYLKQIKRIITEMKELAKELPLYSIVHSLPGIQDILTCKFMAELGDISRFANYKQITAYIGIDPMIRQSGDKDGLHLGISRKGNKRLRTILYLMVSSLTKSNREPNAIKDSYKKRTQKLNPLKPKVASTACANQLVRIIFYMHKTSSTYKYICKQSQTVSTVTLL